MKLKALPLSERTATLSLNLTMGTFGCLSVSRHRLDSLNVSNDLPKKDSGHLHPITGVLTA